MSALEVALADAVKRCRDEQHALAVRACHLEAALLRARQGEDESIVRARLESKGVIVLARPQVAL